MELTERPSSAPESSSWKPTTPDVFSGTRALLALMCAAGLLLAAWMALDASPLGAPAAALASSLVLVLLWAQLIRSEHDAERRHERDAVLALGRLLGSMGPDRTRRDVCSTALREVLQLTGARSLVAALEHRGTGRLLVIRVSIGAPDVVVEVRRAPRLHRAMYFAAAPGTWPDFRDVHPCRRHAVFAFTIRDHWAGRLFLLDPPDDGPADRPGFAMLLQQCVSALSATRDVSRIRRRAAARERVRLGRELHDGVVQELAALDIELELLKRATPNGSHTLAAGLVDVQGRLREQIRDLRHIEERARAYEVDPLRLSSILADLVERFRRDTGIGATFEDPGPNIDLPPVVCGEIVRIVQEALVNVRRHSRARHVAVQFACEHSDWKLRIEDDGQGSRTWGTASAAGPPAAWRPAIIEERVQSIGATLRFAPGTRTGTRLEIAIGRGGPWVSRSFESC